MGPEELNATIVKALVKKYATIAMEPEKKSVRGAGVEEAKSARHVMGQGERGAHIVLERATRSAHGAGAEAWILGEIDVHIVMEPDMSDAIVVMDMAQYSAQIVMGEV